MADLELGDPLHSMVVCGPLSEEEKSSICLNTVPSGDGVHAEGNCRLSLIGLGISPLDITVFGLDRITAKNTEVFLDESTRLLLLYIFGSSENLKRKIKESINSDVIEAYVACIDIEKKGYQTEELDAVIDTLNKGQNVALLSFGDPLSSGNLRELIFKVNVGGFDLEVIHNASLINVIASCGLQVYNYGETVQFPALFSDTLTDEMCSKFVLDDKSFFNKISRNFSIGWHTQCLLYEVDCLPPHSKVNVLSPFAAASILMKLIEKREQLAARTSATKPSTYIEETNIESLSASSVVVCVTGLGLGVDMHCFRAMLLSQAADANHASNQEQNTLSSLVIVGKTHPLEKEYLSLIQK